MGFSQINKSSRLSKRLSSVIALLIIGLLLCCLWGYNVANKVYAESADIQTEISAKIIDDAEVLTQAEKEELLDKIKELGKLIQQDENFKAKVFYIDIFTTRDTDGKLTRVYGDDKFEAINAKADEELDGIYFLLDLDNANYHFGTYGYAIDCFTDARVDDVLDEMYEGFSQDDYYLGFSRGLAAAGDYLSQGVPIDQHREDLGSYDQDKNLEAEKKKNIILSAVIAAVTSVITAVVFYRRKIAKYSKFRAKPDYNFEKEARAEYSVFSNQIIDKHTFVTYSPLHDDSDDSGSSRTSSTRTSSSGRSSGGGSRSL